MWFFNNRFVKFPAKLFTYTFLFIIYLWLVKLPTKLLTYTFLFIIYIVIGLTSLYTDK